MKLQSITEAKSRQPIRDAALALADLNRYLNDQLGRKSAEAIAFTDFLSTPTYRKWDKNKWVVDRAIKSAIEAKDTNLKTRIQKWAFLNTLTSPTIAASVYDMSPSDTKNTPAHKVSLSKNLRDKLKKSVGPSGYVSMLSNAGSNLNANKIKNLIKDTARNSSGLIKATKADLPKTQIPTKF